MKNAPLLLAAFAVLFSAGYAPAASAAAPAPQQNRMKTCATEYHEKKIPKSLYHKFMSNCLKGHAAKGKSGSTKQ
ncbi:MAG: PsiF family protein [Alphaproteobacteria bacterium]|nr:PsiF family protein [Alphaproteobacteria bacterium]